MTIAAGCGGQQLLPPQQGANGQESLHTGRPLNGDGAVATGLRHKEIKLKTNR
jgi:hypothetical protein